MISSPRMRQVFVAVVYGPIYSSITGAATDVREFRTRRAAVEWASSAGGTWNVSRVVAPR